MPQSRIHNAYFYASDEALVGRLTRIVGDALAEKRIVLLFLTQEHKTALVDSLRTCGIDAEAAVQQGRLKLVDARRLLETLLRDDHIDRAGFDTAFHKLLMDAQRSGNEITVCGEIVNLLWHAGHRDLALALEKAWDEALDRHGLHVYCAYSTPDGAGESDRFEPIRRLHSRNEEQAGIRATGRRSA